MTRSLAAVHESGFHLSGRLALSKDNGNGAMRFR